MIVGFRDEDSQPLTVGCVLLHLSMIITITIGGVVGCSCRADRSPSAKPHLGPFGRGVARVVSLSVSPREHSLVLGTLGLGASRDPSRRGLRLWKGNRSVGVFRANDRDGAVQSLDTRPLSCPQFTGFWHLPRVQHIYS